MIRNILKIVTLCLMVVPFIISCSEKLGKEPGNDSVAVVTVYQYPASGKYNPDNDCYLRICTNNKVADVFYLTQLKTDKEALKLDNAAYAEYVATNGKKYEIGFSKYKDLYIEDLHGEYVIAIVYKQGKEYKLIEEAFAGLDYKPLGDFVFKHTFQAFAAEQNVSVEFSSVGGYYRVNNVWTDKGEPLVFTVEKNGSLKFVKAKFKTGFAHQKYGDVFAEPVKGTYDATTKTFNFVLKYIVSAGAFGEFAESLTI